MYLLDTNVVSEIRKAGSGKADLAVLSWIRPIAPQLLYISVMTVFEIEIGILQIERRDGKQGAALRRWMDDGVKRAFENRIIAADEQIAIRSAGFSIPDPRPLRDSFIGATARERNLVLVTRNIRDFQEMGVALVNPWSE